MNREQIKDVLEIVGAAAIVASLVFVALEIRTNTQSNQIAIEQNYSGNWLTINSQIVGNDQFADVVARAKSGQELSSAESEQVGAYVRMVMTQSFHILNLYDEGLVSSDEVRSAFRALRELAASADAFRAEVETVGDRRRREMILEPDGLDKWLQGQ